MRQGQEFGDVGFDGGYEDGGGFGGRGDRGRGRGRGREY